MPVDSWDNTDEAASVCVVQLLFRRNGMLTTLDQCDNCGRTIGKLEKSCVWQDHIVCSDCHDKLERAGRVETSETMEMICGTCGSTIDPGEERHQLIGKTVCKFCFNRTRNAPVAPVPVVSGPKKALGLTKGQALAVFLVGCLFAPVGVGFLMIVWACLADWQIKKNK